MQAPGPGTHVGSGIERTHLLCLLARCQERLNQALSVLSLSLGFFCMCFVMFTRATVLCCVITGRMPRSGKTAGIKFTRRPKIRFLPHRGNSLHRFMLNLVGPRGTWVRLAVQNFTSIGAGGWECGPKISKVSTFW